MRCYCDQWLMIPEDTFIIQIEIIISDTLDFIAVSECVIEGCIQMIISPSDPDVSGSAGSCFYFAGISGFPVLLGD